MRPQANRIYLARIINVEYTDGRVDIYHLSIVSLGEAIDNECLSITVKDFKIEKYTEEIPNVEYSDKSILLTQLPDNTWKVTFS